MYTQQIEKPSEKLPTKTDGTNQEKGRVIIT